MPIKLSAKGFAFMRGQVFLVVLAIVQLPGFALSPIVWSSGVASQR